MSGTWKLIIGNRNYSSWSFRGWLAARHSGLPFEEVEVRLFEENWAERRREPDILPSGGTVPLLWHEGVASWNALAIIDRMDQLTGGTRFWPEDPGRRSFAQSISADMQASFVTLRTACPMNIRRHYPGFQAPEDLKAGLAADVARVDMLWCQALAESGGPYLFGDWGAADIMFAPVVSRLITYDQPLSPPARRYQEAILAQRDVAEWMAKARQERATLAQFEY